MTSRFFFLVAASVCAAVFAIRPASAQAELPLRASYQGEFLPGGTEIIVLSKEGRVQRDGRYQPEFFPTREFPRTSRGALRRDRLNDTGRSSRSYTETQDSGRLYFIYALTPDSTLYWSYSARRDSLKFDVVSTGVMSVAPVSTPDIRQDVLASFFEPRITVVMSDGREGAPGRRTRTGEPADLDKTGGGAADLDDSGPMDAEPDSSILTTDVTLPQAGIEEAAQDTAAAQADVPPVASAAQANVPPVAAPSPPVRSASSGVTLPPMLAWSLLVLVLVGVAVPAYLASTYRNELKRLRRQTLRLREQAAAAEDLGKDQRLERLKEDFEVLHARYVALEKERELQKM